MSIREQVHQFLCQSPFCFYADGLVELLRPSLRINVHADPSISRSHFGGLPEIPAGFELPVWDMTPYWRSELAYFQQLSLQLNRSSERIAKIQ